MRKATTKDKETMKKYYESHKQRLKEKQKDFYLKNKEQVSKKAKEKYWQKRIEKILYQRKYYFENRDLINEKSREFMQSNPELIKEWKKKYEINNIQKVRARNLARKTIKIPLNQICEMCQLNKATERHHEDYSKPKDVKFVCHACNCKEERIICRV